jgi:NAD(P)-dependent dehydrogenase (short-subunit alcohol dehydrogenase family)
MLAMRRVLITGASRGLGLEFVRQCLPRGASVFAGCRTPENAMDLQMLSAAHPEQLTILTLDVTDKATIDASVEIIRSQVDGLDLLINNAGVYPRGELPTNLNAETLLQAFRVNSIGPMIVAQRCLELLRAGDHTKIVNISSKMGSLWWKEKEGGGDYSYCSSKAALNMLTRTLAFDLRSDGIIVVGLIPGWVQTDMGGSDADLTPTESVGSMLKVVDRLTLADTSKLFTWEDREHPW